MRHIEIMQLCILVCLPCISRRQEYHNASLSLPVADPTAWSARLSIKEFVSSDSLILVRGTHGFVSAVVRCLQACNKVIWYTFVTVCNSYFSRYCNVLYDRPSCYNTLTVKELKKKDSSDCLNNEVTTIPRMPTTA